MGKRKWAASNKKKSLPHFFNTETQRQSRKCSDNRAEQFRPKEHRFTLYLIVLCLCLVMCLLRLTVCALIIAHLGPVQAAAMASQ